MPIALTYPVQLTPAVEGGFIVTSPFLPIFTQGDTEEEALANAKEALLCHLEGCAKEQPKKGVARFAMLKIQIPN